MESAGKLYIVPTPVGNLEDMTFRAVKVLQEADLILAEDTRTSSVLLKHYDIHGKLQSHHKFNEHQTAAAIKDHIMAGLNVALISDAGTPGISDPGFLLARTCANEGIEVQTLPGDSIVRPAMRPFLLRRLPSGEERTPDNAEDARAGDQDNDFLRISISSGKDIGAVCRIFRRRP